MKFVLILGVAAFCAGPSVAEPLFGNLVSGMTNTMGSMVQAAASASSTTYNLAANAASEATNNAKAAASSAANAASGAVQKGMDVAKSFTMAGVNTGVKILLEELKMLVKSSGHGRLDIADIDVKKGPLHFNATKGYFGDISTIKIDGAIDMNVQNWTMLITVPLALGTVDVGYKKFEVGMWKMNTGGGINIHIGTDSFIVTLRVKAGIKCIINVEKVEVTKFGDVKIDFSDMGAKSEWVMEKATNVISKLMEETMKAKVQEALDSNIKKILSEDGTICSKFVGQ